MNDRVAPLRLTSLAHGGGCGCKIAPGVLGEILKSVPGRALPAELLSGTENNEDAAVYKLNEGQALVATTDFFTPIFALALLGMPINTLPLEVIRRITEGGESICAEAGIPVAGGHSIDTVEPIYGLVVLGLVHPDKVKRNHTARAGDAIVLGKPIGVGILSAALKQGKLSEAGYRRMVDCTTKLNTPGIALAGMAGVHALTDVTGFGLAGHLLEMCRGARLRAEIRFDELPLIPEALEYVKAGISTGASTRNWAGYGKEVALGTASAEWQQKLLTDPQTSGGLLVACAPESEAEVLALFAAEGFGEARRIGRFAAGNPELAVA